MPLRFLKEGMDFAFGETEHDSIYLGHVSETPSDADIGEGNTAFYAKSDGNLYKRPYGGTESGIGGGGSGGDFNHALSETLDAQGNDITDVGSLQTAEATIDHLPNSGLSSGASPVPQGQHRVPWPSFERVDSNPKLTVDDLDGSQWPLRGGSEIHDIHWPSVINTAEISDPLAENYCYFAPHDSDGFGLAYFDDPEGEWSHVEGPIEPSTVEAGAMVKNGEVWLYSNTPNNTNIKLWRTADGRTNLTDEGIVYSTADSGHDPKGHCGYPHVMQTPGGDVVATSMWSGFGAYHSQAIHISEDGMTDWTHLTQSWGSHQEPTGADKRWAHTAMVPYAPVDGYLVFWTAVDRTGENLLREVRMGWTRNGLNIHDVGVVLTPETTYEDGDIVNPEPFWYDGDLYLAYASGNVSMSNPSSTNISLAVADFGGAA